MGLQSLRSTAAPIAHAVAALLPQPLNVECLLKMLLDDTSGWRGRFPQRPRLVLSWPPWGATLQAQRARGDALKVQRFDLTSCTRCRVYRDHIELLATLEDDVPYRQGLTQTESGQDDQPATSEATE